MPSKYSLLFVISVVFFISCSSDDATVSNPPDDVIEALDPSVAYEELNISYGPDSDQVFDLYLPANRTSDTKVMILVHGGAWIEGDKDDMDYLVYLLQLELPQIAIANINYRLADADNLPIPMQTDDITSVVNMLKENQEYYTISDELGFIGTSAGGHLSLLWSYIYDQSNTTKMVCSIVGPTNLADPEYTENPAYDPLFQIFGDALTDEFLESVSPYHQATGSVPPTILFYGGQDPLVPTSQGVDMDAKLTELGVTHEFTLYPEEGHGWDGTNLLDTWLKLKLFTQTYLE